LSEIFDLEYGPSQGQLVFTFRNKQPIAAVALARFLSAMARDYSKLTRGRSLAVSQVESGSIILHVQDAVAAAAALAPVVVPLAKDAVDLIQAGEALAKFAKSVRGAFWKAKESPQATLQKGGALSTIAAAVEVAADAGAELKVDYAGRETDAFSLRMTPPEAVKIREEAASVREQQRMLAASEVPLLLQAPAATTVGDHADALEQAFRMLPATGSDENLRAMMRALVATLRAVGLDYMVSTISTELSSRGQYGLAQALISVASEGRDKGGFVSQLT